MRRMIIGFIIAGWPLPAFAADWYVDASAAAGGDGSMGAPFAALQAGIDAAMPGDTVHVLPGSYGAVQSVRSGAEGSRITIAATEPRMAIIEAVGTGFEIHHSHHTVEGLVIDCGYGTGDCVEGGGNDALELVDLEIRRSAQDCIDLRIANGVLIEATEIHHCIAPYDPEDNADAHGITGDSVFDLTVRDSSIHMVTGDAIQIAPPREAWGGLLVESSRLWAEPLDESVNGWTKGTVIGENAFDSKVGEALDGAGQNPTAVFRDVVAYGWRGPISNAAAFNVKEAVDFLADGVTVYDSEIAFRLRAPAVVAIFNTVIHDVDVGARFEEGLPAPRIENSTFGDTVVEAFTDADGGAAGPSLRNLLFLADAVPALAMGDASNMAVGDDVFVDAANDDYRLLETAAPVDAGVTIDDIAADRDGVPRPVGDAFDIGAFEWTDMPPPADTSESSDGVGSGSSSSEDDSASTSDETSGPEDGPAPETTGVDVGSSESGAGQGDGGGCGCRSSHPSLWIAMLLGGLMVRRRLYSTGENAPT